MKILIGLVAPMGAGKEEFFKVLNAILEKHSLARYSTSRILQQTALLWNQPCSRPNLQNLALQMEQLWGEGALSRAVENDLQKSDATEELDIIIYDSIRWRSDVDVVRKYPSVIVSIDADQRLRWQRTKERKQKVGEEAISFEEFSRLELEATETMIPTLFKYADSHLDNNGTREEFVAQIRSLLENVIEPKLR
jgi:dephospho-CoA kinase